MQFGACYGGTIIFYPVYLMLFTVISMETRNTSGVVIQILMTRFFDLVTGNNLKSGFSKTIFFDRKWCKQQHKRQQAELLVQLRTENHALLESGESGTCSVGKNLRRVNSVDLVTYLSIREALVKTCSSNATTAKIWNLRNFCQVFARQKLEVNRIGSSATRPSVLHRIFVWFFALLISKPSKNHVSQTILLPCNSKGLIFDFYLNRKRNKCWFSAYSFELFTWQYFDRDTHSVIYHTTLLAML